MLPKFLKREAEENVKSVVFTSHCSDWVIEVFLDQVSQKKVLEMIFILRCSYLTSNEWYCKDNADCLPWKLSGKNQVENIYENQNICRLLCGKNGALWPKPTGKCELGKSVVDVNTNLIR